MEESNKKINPQQDPEIYFDKSYDSKGRFISYWYQINEIYKLNPTSVLEIGIGNGFVCNYLRLRGLALTTLDIERRLNPNIVGNVINIPFKDNTFDIVTCYELFEHFPYDDFYKALSEILCVTKFSAILSLPDIERVYRVDLQIPKFGEIKKLIRFPRFKKPIHKFNGYHYWEIGKAGYPLKKIVKDIQSIGFRIGNTYRVFENPYHRFFILKK